MMRGVFLAMCLLMIVFGFGYLQEAGQLKCDDTTKLERDDPIHQRLANTVRLLPGPCSGSLVVFEGRTASEKALVLTAGHCTLRAPGPGEVFRTRKQERALTPEGHPDVFNDAWREQSTNTTISRMLQRLVVDNWPRDKAFAETVDVLTKIYGKYA